MNEAINELSSVLGALDGIEVKGKQNHLIVIACMNSIEKVIKALREKEADDGNTNPESKS